MLDLVSPECGGKGNSCLIELTVSHTRGVEQKKALYRCIVENLGERQGVRPQDVFVNLVEVQKESWSFGDGIAQYA